MIRHAHIYSKVNFILIFFYKLNIKEIISKIFNLKNFIENIYKYVYF